MSNDKANLPPGVYDLLLDQALAHEVEALDETVASARREAIDPAEIGGYVADRLRNVIATAIGAIGEAQRAELSRALAGAVASVIQERVPALGGVPPTLSGEPERLIAIDKLDALGRPKPLEIPATPLRDTVLFTNARGEPHVGHELASELASADSVDIVMAFVRFSGIRTLIDAIQAACARGAQIRLITTIYTGSTEIRALKELTEAGAKIKVSYEIGATRLHAKSWHFRRESGFSTVYIGSSNLTHSAQVTGIEWNVRASEPTNPALIDAFTRTFETYWADPKFELFDEAKFLENLSIQKRKNDVDFATFDLRPYPFQSAMLEDLRDERASGANSCLLVAATGTGKTLVSAFDYRNYLADHPSSRLLFVAHRAQILKQSRTAFRHVLKDGSFGELWAEGERPTQFDHVFASVQSLSANDAHNLDPSHFDVVVVDEFHHAGADTYEALLNHLKPSYLLGLTATPERHDGIDIFKWFGGKIAVELRLWDALEQQLIAPFHYFGVYDGSDLRGVTWRKGHGYDTPGLENIYTADDAWLRRVVSAVQKYGSSHITGVMAYFEVLEGRISGVGHGSGSGVAGGTWAMGRFRGRGPQAPAR